MVSRCDATLLVSRHIGFFVRRSLNCEGIRSFLAEIGVRQAMYDSNIQMTQQLAAAASEQQAKMTGRTPRIVSGVLSVDTLVLTLHDALTPAETALAQRPGGADQVEEFHRQLFSTSSATMREEIQRVTGQEVVEFALEAVRDTGAVIHSFPSGALVQVYLLSQLPDGSPQPDDTAIERVDEDDWQPIPARRNPTYRPFNKWTANMRPAADARVTSPGACVSVRTAVGPKI